MTSIRHDQTIAMARPRMAPARIDIEPEHQATDSTDRTMSAARAQYISFHPGPAGMQVNANGRIEHQIQRGESLSKIAREYSQADHLEIPWRDIYALNREAIGPNPSLIHASDPPLVMPQINEKVDGEILASSDLVVSNGELRHKIHYGDTLSKIARHYNEHFGLELRYQDIFDANRDQISNPNVISSRMRPIAIPGITSPIVSGPSIEDFEGKTLATLHALVQGDHAHDVQSIPMFTYSLDVPTAFNAGRTYEGALQAARAAVLNGDIETAAAIVQTHDGAYWVGGVNSTATGQRIPSGTQVFDFHLQTNDDALKGWVERPHFIDSKGPGETPWDLPWDR